MATLIKDGRIVTAVDDYIGDILIEDGKVRMLGQGIPAEGGVEVHDAGGCLVMPGAIDVHTHLDWEFGSARTVGVPVGTKPRLSGGAVSRFKRTEKRKGKAAGPGRGGRPRWPA